MIFIYCLNRFARPCILTPATRAAIDAIRKGIRITEVTVPAVAKLSMAIPRTVDTKMDRPNIEVKVAPRAVKTIPARSPGGLRIAFCEEAMQRAKNAREEDKETTRSFEPMLHED